MYLGEMRHNTREAIVGYLFIAPSLIGFGIFFIVPFISSLYFCFTGGIGVTRFVGLKNFVDLFNSDSFILAFRNTIIFKIISVPLVMLVSFSIALLLTNKIKGLSYFRTLYIVPLIIPIASVILVWKIVFDEFGIINNIFVKNDIFPINWFQGRWSLVILVLLYIWKNCGYNVILFIAGINSIPKTYYEAARIDGAGPIKCLLGITIPYLMPTTFFVFIMSIINAFKVFKEAYLLAGSYPDTNIYMLQHFMNNNFFNLSYQRLTTAAFVTSILIYVLVYIGFKFENKIGENI